MLAGALLSLPYWPEEARTLWRGAPVAAPVAATPAPAPAAPAPVIDTAAVDAAKRELTARIDDLEKRMRGVAATAAQADQGGSSDAAIAELRGKISVLESRPGVTLETERDVAALKTDIASLRTAISDAAEKAKADASALGTGEQKALAAARASAVIGIAARAPRSTRACPSPPISSCWRRSARTTPSSPASSRPCSRRRPAA